MWDAMECRFLAMDLILRSPVLGTGTPNAEQGQVTSPVVVLLSANVLPDDAWYGRDTDLSSTVNSVRVGVTRHVPSEQYSENFDSGAQGNTPYAPTKEVMHIMQISGEAGISHKIHRVPHTIARSLPPYHTFRSEQTPHSTLITIIQLHSLWWCIYSLAISH